MQSVAFEIDEPSSVWRAPRTQADSYSGLRMADELLAELIFIPASEPPSLADRLFAHCDPGSTISIRNLDPWRMDSYGPEATVQKLDGGIERR